MDVGHSWFITNGVEARSLYINPLHQEKTHSMFASNFVKSVLLMYFYGKKWKIYKNNYNIECSFFLMRDVDRITDQWE